MHVLFATPTAGGIVKSCYAITLFKTVVAVRDAGGGAEFVTVDGSDISAARNYFANLLLRLPEFTHLLMIDSDMSVDGDVICRLLHCDKPVVGAAYPKRQIDLRAFAQAARNPELGLLDLTSFALEYTVWLEPGVVQVTEGMCRVERMPLGCAAIRRDAFEGLIAAGVVQLRPDHILQSLGLQGPCYDFFGQITCEDGDRLSEDYSFCERWRRIPGNEIWALVDGLVGHVGDMVYGAPYLNRLRQEDRILTSPVRS